MRVIRVTDLGEELDNIKTGEENRYKKVVWIIYSDLTK